MKSNYKRIGDFIELVDERNKALKVKLLLGLSVTKQFIPSVANTVGTNMRNYKIIRKNQFACSTMQVRRDKKMPVALLKDFDEAIISQAYPVFQVVDETQLLPDYLMMWMTRAEFDRHAEFLAVGGVRGTLEWEDFLNMTLPVPAIEKQREIVAEYNTITNRIQLNEQLNQKLEETAQTLYKHWFVDFEFPDEQGNPYKSSGGKMIYNDELDKEIPKGWKATSFQGLIDKDIIYKNQDGNHGELHPKSGDYVSSGVPFIMAKDIANGILSFEDCKFISHERAANLRIGFAQPNDVLLTHKGTMGRVCIVPAIREYVIITPQVTYYRVKNKDLLNSEFLYCLFNSVDFQNTLIGESEQSTRKFLSISNQRMMILAFPDKKTINQFQVFISPILYLKICLHNISITMNQLKTLALSKMAFS